MDPNSVAQAITRGSQDPVAIIGVLIPIVAIVMGLGIGMLKIWLDFRKKREILQAHHAERMAAIDKGIELPALPPGFYGAEGTSVPPEVLQQELKGRQAGLHYLRGGLMWLLIGIAISLALAIAWIRATITTISPRTTWASLTADQAAERCGLLTLLCVAVMFGVQSAT
ncbi:MAG TPA: hypothetical protein VII41_17335, partial [Steroidobacteraceae bacterium]